MKQIILILLFFSFLTLHFSHLSSQIQQEWVKRYPDTTTFNASASALALDDSGNVFVTGHAAAYSFSAYCTVKYSSSGVQQWVRFYYGSNYGGRNAFAIALDESSNVYITGYSNNPTTNFDYCTIKYNSNGVQQWVKYYDDKGHGNDQAQKIAVDNVGNIYVTGFSSNDGGDNYAYLTIKYSPDGRELWTRRYGHGYTFANGITIDDSCNIYLTGENNMSSTTIKYDSAGNQKWVQTYSGFGIGQTGANSIVLDNLNNVYITGFSQTYSPTQRHLDCFTIKYSFSGTQQWVRRFYFIDTIGNETIGNTIKADNSGNLFVGGWNGNINGSYHSNLCLIKYSDAGDLIWNRIDSSTLSSETSKMAMDSKKNIYISGATGVGTQSSSYLIIKYDSSGFLQWRQIYNIQNNDSYPYAVELNRNFNIFITGSSGASMCTIKYSQPVGIIEYKRFHNSFKLYQNWPNPFNQSTIIDYELPITNYVKLVVFDILGKIVTILVNEKQKLGKYNIAWNGENYASGVYFYSLIVNGIIFETKKLVLLK